MLGSLYQFMPVYKEQFQLENKLKSQSIENKQRNRSLDQRKHHILKYETSDKTDILRRNRNKTQVQYKPNHEILAWVNKNESEQKNKSHWIQKKNALSLQSHIKQKHKLLHAIVKTKQLQNHRQSLTLFEKSFQRISQQFSKIKMHHNQTILINPLMADTKLLKQKIIHSKKSRSCPLSPQRLLQCENSVKWAKKHKKNFKSFYQQLGKSVQLAQKQKMGNSNYKLQQIHASKEGQIFRQKNRRQFLDRISKRLSKHSTIKR